MRAARRRNPAVPSCLSSAAILLLGLLLLAPRAPAQTIFSDGTFPDGTWFLNNRYAGGSGNATGGHQSSGGNPTDYYRFTISTTAGPSGIIAFGRNSSFTYDPSSQGAISSLVFSVSLQNQGGVGTAFLNLAIEQNFQIFVGPEYLTTSTNWVNFAETLTASSFSLLVSPGNGEFALDSTSHPDFSTNGAGISFGFSSLFNADPGSPGGSETMGVDNYNLIVNAVAVPEPSATMLLLLAGFATFMLARGRRPGFPSSRARSQA